MNKKTYVLLFLTFILIVQNNYVISQDANNSINNTSVSNYDGFNVTVYGVMQGVTNISSTNEVYRIVSQTDITFVRILLNVSGSTDLTPSSISSTRTQNTTLGDLFLIVNGEITKVTGLGSLTDVYDYRIPFPAGKYVITFAYLGKDDYDGFVYAYDTVKVEISDVDNFSDWTYNGSLVKINPVDHYQPATVVNKQLAYWEAGWGEFYPNNTFVGDISLDAVYTDIEDVTNLDISYNSTGSDSFQNEGSFIGTEGHLFYYDSEGIHPYVEGQLVDLISCNEISNPLGLILFREAGVLSTEWSIYEYYDWETLNLYDSIKASIDFDPEVFSIDDLQDSTITETTTDITDTSDTDTSDTDTSDTDTSDTDTSESSTSVPVETTPETTRTTPNDTPGLNLPFEFVYLVSALIILPILRRKMK